MRDKEILNFAPEVSNGKDQAYRNRYTRSGNDGSVLHRRRRLERGRQVNSLTAQVAFAHELGLCIGARRTRTGLISGLEARISANPLSYRDAMEARRRELVMKALEQSHGSRAGAARILGLHEKYFLRLVKTLGIN